jgi:hypothetical protein
MTRWLLASAATWALLAPVARAQEAVVIACVGTERCTFKRGFSPTVLGKDSVRVVPPGAKADAKLLRQSRSVRIASIAGLYRDPGLGLVYLLDRDGTPGDIVLPRKLPAGAQTAADASVGWTLEYREQPKSKARESVPNAEFVALLFGPALDVAVVRFVRREAQSPRPHPAQQQLIAGALAFAGGSAELQAWRDEIRDSMRRSLELFRDKRVDPAQLEATLADGIAAMQIHRLVSAEGQKEESLQERLTSEYRRLLDRFAIAGALKDAGMHDAYLEKLDQIGLARWSRPALVAGIDEALQASARSHLQRARELFADKQYARAFDEARLASRRAPCDEETSTFYYHVRVEFVNQNTIPATPEYDGRQRSLLLQIVRELEGIEQEPTLTPDRAEFVRKRIAEGERLDKDYLPLQLEKAKFLARAGELTASRDVVTEVERQVQLGRTASEEWLRLDGTLNANLLTLRQKTARLVPEQFAAGEFKAALQTIEDGLRAEPDNPQFLYLAAAAAAVLRDQERTKRYVERHLALLAQDCSGTADVSATLFELYRRPAPGAPATPAGDQTPNWISGEVYEPGEAFYDPVSGSFNSRLVTSVDVTGETTKDTDFQWDGFRANSIRTTESAKLTRRVVLEIEPVYDQKRVYMSGIGMKASSAGQQRVMDLRYVNCPDFDPVLAAKFSGNVSTRGWAGNPFFHPFIWNDIFLFDLVYDDIGRITQAVPVRADATRPVSPFSETLTFNWDGASKRLLSIVGAKYRREMKYDSLGRLVAETITHPTGRGKIEYDYEGDSLRFRVVECEDDFYDRRRRRILLMPAER